MASALGRRRNEKGYVLAFFAVSLLGLILMIGVAVDLGSWYLRASKLQRAADVAALSGASALPATDQARQRALDSLRMNGFSASPRVSVNVQVSESTVNVQIDDSAVPTHFLKPLFDSIKMGRDSNAVKSSAIPLGNPFNIFGYGANTGDSRNIGVTGGAPQGFWAAVNGYCTPKEDGDYFSSAFDSNKSPTRHTCNNAALANPDYAGDSNGYVGYNYKVEVPPGAGTVDLLAWDAQYNPRETGAADVDTRLSGDSESGTDTSFNVYRKTGTSESLIYSRFFRDGDPTAGINGSGWAIWSRLASVGAGEYRINVTSRIPSRIRSNSPSNLQSTGWNTYALMASRTSNPLQMCDSRTAGNTCPRISGVNAVSVYVNRSGATSDFFLADISPGMVGTSLEAYLWDPGEGTQSMELINPSGQPVPFVLTVEPDNGDTSTTPRSVLDVSGNGPQPRTGLRGTGKYNDRLVKLRFTPTAGDYSGSTDSWWKLRYRAGSGTVTDRTTWGVSVGRNSPVYLSAPQ